MAIFLLILKILGWTLLGILAVVVLALFVRVRIVADYGEKPSVVVKWLFLKIPLYPKAKKAKKAVQAPPPTEEAPPAAEPPPAGEPPPTEETPPAEKTPPAGEPPSAEKKKGSNLLKTFFDTNGGVDGLVLLLRQVFSYIGSFTGSLLRAFVVEELQMDITVTKPDAAQTAVYYGKVCSTVFPLLGTLVTKYRVRKYDCSIQPDFLAKSNAVALHVAMYVRPAVLIGIVLLLGLRLIFRVGLKVVLRMLRPVLAARKENKKNTSNTEEKSGATNE